MVVFQQTADLRRSTVTVEIDQSSLVEQAGVEGWVDISGCRVCASRDLTRKMGRDELLVGQRAHNTVFINAIYPNGFVYTLFLVHHAF